MSSRDNARKTREKRKYKPKRRSKKANRANIPQGAMHGKPGADKKKIYNDSVFYLNIFNLCPVKHV